MNHVVLACEAAIDHLGLRRRAGSKKILSPESKSLQIWHFLKCSGWSIVVPGHNHVLAWPTGGMGLISEQKCLGIVA